MRSLFLLSGSVPKPTTGPSSNAKGPGGERPGAPSCAVQCIHRDTAQMHRIKSRPIQLQVFRGLVLTPEDR